MSTGLVLLLFAVFDSKAEAFSPPFTMRTKGEAMRSFADEANRQGSAFAAHPEDFTLFHLGQVNLVTGAVQALPTPDALALALNVVTVVREQAANGRNRVGEALKA